MIIVSSGKKFPTWILYSEAVLLLDLLVCYDFIVIVSVYCYKSVSH